MSAPTLTGQALESAFRAVGLRAGDVVLVHSSLRKLGPVDGGADTVIDALLAVLGPDGLLALPTHTFRVVNAGNPVFHQDLTPSNVGVLSNVFRRRAGVVRGLHPTHSVAAMGRRAEEFVAIREQDEGTCPPDSPYGRLRDWKGKVLIIGPGLECCTFFHGCEQWADLPLTHAAQAVQLYSIASDGRVVPIRVRPNSVNTWDQYPRLEPLLLEIGALRTGRVGDCPLRLLDAAAAADWLVPRLKNDAGIILADDSRP